MRSMAAAFILAIGLMHTAPAAEGDRARGGKTASGPDSVALRLRELKHAPRVEDLRRELASPLYTRSLRDKKRTAIAMREADLSGGYALESDRPTAEFPETAADDFVAFMSVVMGVAQYSGDYPIIVEHGRPEGCPPGAAEGFHLVVAKSNCRITANDDNGIRRALIYLEDEMTARGGPFLPLGPVSRWAAVETRIIHSPLATDYGCYTDWDTDDDYLEAHPDGYLDRLAHSGINGIWVGGKFRNMLATKTLPELGPKANRLENLKRLVEKAARYGIKVYLYCMEPRTVPADHAVFQAHPEIRGAGGVWTSTPMKAVQQNCLCVSAPLVQQYLREATQTLFTEVPKLGGLICIFNGERPTTCWLNASLVQGCPRCRVRSQAEVLAADVSCFIEGIRLAKSKGKFMAWTYYDGSRPYDPVEIMKRSDPAITWLGNFEHGGWKTVQGKRFMVNEYSLSYIGPSEAFAKMARDGKNLHREVYAKLQIGNSHELESVPYLPMPGVVYDKFAAMQSLGVTGTMASWMMGGCPSIMLKAAGEASFAPLPSKQAFLDRLAAQCGGAAAAGTTVAAWNDFAAAFARYPATPSVFYYVPIHRSPAYQLHLEREPRLAKPYNFGMDFTLRVQPWEDQVSHWLQPLWPHTPGDQPFTPEELMRAYRDVGAGWQKGVALLAKARRENPRAEELKRQYQVADAGGLMLLSTANVIEFYASRDRLRQASPAEQPALVARMIRVAEDDVALAREMKDLVKADPSIGFWSYPYLNYPVSEVLLDAKIRQVEQMLPTLRRWWQSGVEKAVLDRNLPPQP